MKDRAFLVSNSPSKRQKLDHLSRQDQVAQCFPVIAKGFHRVALGACSLQVASTGHSQTVEELPAAWQVDTEYHFGVTSVDPSSNIMDCAAESFSTKVSLSLAGNKVAKFIEGSAALLFMARIGLGLGGTKRYRPLKHIERILTNGSFVGERARRDAKGAVGAVGTLGTFFCTSIELRLRSLSVSCRRD